MRLHRRFASYLLTCVRVLYHGVYSEATSAPLIVSLLELSTARRLKGATMEACDELRTHAVALAQVRLGYAPHPIHTFGPCLVATRTCYCASIGSPLHESIVCCVG